MAELALGSCLAGCSVPTFSPAEEVAGPVPVAEYHYNSRGQYLLR